MARCLLNSTATVLSGVILVFFPAFNSAYSDNLTGNGIQSCLTCHADNNAAIPGPQLGGFSAAYIKEQLYNYQKGLRGGGDPAAAAMAQVAAPLNDDEIKVLSKQAASLKGRRLIDFNTSAKDSGLAIYNDKCSGCHNGILKRWVTGSPALDYLDADYIGRQLSLFASDVRGFSNPSKHQIAMKEVASELSEAERRQIVSYLDNN